MAWKNLDQEIKEEFINNEPTDFDKEFESRVSRLISGRRSQEKFRNSTHGRAKKIAYMKEYCLRPEVKERNREYSRKYRNKLSDNKRRLGLLVDKGFQTPARIEFHKKTRKLTMDQAKEVRLKFSEGRTRNSLAIEYDLNWATVAAIVSGRTYKTEGLDD